MALTHDAQSFIIIVSILSVLSTVFAVTRLVIRRNGMLGIDDYILAFAVVMVWAQAACAYMRKFKAPSKFMVHPELIFFKQSIYLVVLASLS